MAPRSNAKRPTNGELVDAMASMLTEGAKKVMTKAQLEKTKEWRGELWKQLAEMKKRLCPSPQDNYGDER
jgi:hypothetical protein